MQSSTRVGDMSFVSSQNKLWIQWSQPTSPRKHVDRILSFFPTLLLNANNNTVATKKKCSVDHHSSFPAPLIDVFFFNLALFLFMLGQGWSKFASGMLAEGCRVEEEDGSLVLRFYSTICLRQIVGCPLYRMLLSRYLLLFVVWLVVLVSVLVSVLHLSRWTARRARRRRRRRY